MIACKMAKLFAFFFTGQLNVEDRNKSLASNTTPTQRSCIASSLCCEAARSELGMEVHCDGCWTCNTFNTGGQLFCGNPN